MSFTAPTEVLTALPPRLRKGIYVALGLLGLAGAALLAFYAAAAAVLGGIPWWLTAGLAALGTLLAPFGAIAASNVKAAGVAVRRIEVPADTVVAALPPEAADQPEVPVHVGRGLPTPQD